MHDGARRGWWSERGSAGEFVAEYDFQRSQLLDVTRGGVRKKTERKQSCRCEDIYRTCSTRPLPQNQKHKGHHRAKQVRHIPYISFVLPSLIQLSWCIASHHSAQLYVYQYFFIFFLFKQRAHVHVCFLCRLRGDITEVNNIHSTCPPRH